MTSDLTLATAYWDDPASRAAFKRFMLEIFGLDFSEWESAGYWDASYRPFSYFRKGEVVANVCVYLLDAIIDGRETRLAQISAVGTLPHWRAQGLNRRLLEAGLEWARGKHEGVFLFGTEGAIPFYERCGFRAHPEFIEQMPSPGTARRPGLRKLDCTRLEDRETIYECARRRAPISRRFAVLNAKLLMFHALHALRDHVYEIPELECVVFYKREKRCLQVLDLVAARVLTLDQLYPYLAAEDDQLVEFHFSSDRMGVEGTRLVPWPQDNCFVKGSFPLERPVFPFTAKA